MPRSHSVEHRRAVPLEADHPRRHILVVEDDAAIRRLLRNLFEGEGYLVSEAKSHVEMTACLAHSTIALVTLDLTLGADDGLSIMRDLRTRSKVPVIMVSAKGAEVDRVVGLEIGADDYISKPFSVREVLARVRAVLRRYDAPALPDANAKRMGFRFGPWTLDVTARQLEGAHGDVVLLTTREFNLLEAFVRRPARVLSRDALIDLVGGADLNPLERAIDTLVGRLRRKIEADPANPELIKSVRGIGYVFATPVTSFERTN